MNRALLIEVTAIYLPLSICLLLIFLTRPKKKVWIAGLMAFTWQIAILPPLNLLALKLGWWEFKNGGVIFLGLPVSLYLGWVLFWSFLITFWQESPQWRSVVKKYSVPVITILFLIIDLILMPLMEPVLVLKENWILGEVLLLLISLVPAQILVRAKVHNIYLNYRAIHISIAFILVSFLILPSLQQGYLSETLQSIRGQNPIFRSVFSVLLFLCSLPGLSALQDFIVRGKGTPIPYDPPQKLVTSGVYGYCANPIQLSMFLMQVGWGFFTGSWVCYAIAAIVVIYSIGIAHWSEGRDMQGRFGEEWKVYRSNAPSWLIRLTPSLTYPVGSLYIAKKCNTCSELRRWFERKTTTNLTFHHAESYDGEVLSRVTYTSGDYRVNGILAIAEAFQHLNITYAFIGWLIKLPLINQVLQLAFDNSGAEARKCRNLLL